MVVLSASFCILGHGGGSLRLACLRRSRFASRVCDRVRLRTLVISSRDVSVDRTALRFAMGSSSSSRRAQPSPSTPSSASSARIMQRGRVHRYSRVRLVWPSLWTDPDWPNGVCSWAWPLCQTARPRGCRRRRPAVSGRFSGKSASKKFMLRFRVSVAKFRQHKVFPFSWNINFQGEKSLCWVALYLVFVVFSCNINFWVPISAKSVFTKN